MEKTSKVKKVKEKSQDTPSSKIFWAFMYLILIIVVLISACFIFDRTYYTPFYVVGRSMAPTLNNQENVAGGFYEYGIVDEHHMAMKSLKRYDLVITYYPEDVLTDETSNSSSSTSESEIIAPAAYKPNKVSNLTFKDNTGQKIKRVIGLPNETVTISVSEDENKTKFNEISITKLIDEEETTFVLDLPFTPLDKNGLARAIAEHNNKAVSDIKKGDSFETTLKEGEYFVMGDNWGHSDDSTSLDVGPIGLDLMSGVVIRIEGKVKIEGNKVTERIEYKDEDIRYYKR